MPKINPDTTIIQDNRDRFRPRTSPPEDTIQSLDPSIPHASEFLDGQWLQDEWISPKGGTIRLLVSTPEPLPRDAQEKKNREAGDPLDSLKLGRQLVRDVTFEPGVPVRVPSVYREAIRQTRDGYVVGGLLPTARLVGTEPIPIHPAIVPAQGPNVPQVAQPANGEPMLAGGMFEADDDTPERRALARARQRRGA
jgi:hypothetical protein